MKLQSPVRGDALVQALGSRLPKVAAFYGKTPAALRDLAHRDHTLHADHTGHLHYVCEGMVHHAPPGEEQGEVSEAPPFPDSQTFLLHSRPGATKVVYLDFDSHTTSGKSWNDSYSSGNDFYTPSYDIDGDTNNFSSAELERIQKIWQRVSGDFAMFDVDVTTEDPGEDALRRRPASDAGFGIRVCIGGSSSDWFGTGAGGVAYVGSFSWSSDTPCYVFVAELANGAEKAVAEASSHEVGHALGLHHDGVLNGPSYYGGHGSGATGWAPIMGVSYNKTVTQWSKGEYIDANNTEDDLAEMQNYGVAYRTDDHGNDYGSSTLVPVGTAFSLPGNIETSGDLDVFAIQAGSGQVTFTVAMATPSPNLDVRLELHDVLGNLLTATNPPASLGLTLQTTVNPGTYYLILDGVGTGDPTTGYSDYGSLGVYTLDGTVPTPLSSPANLRVVGN